MNVFDDWQSLVSVVLRFVHVVYGILWLGHLFFLNLVNVPFQGDLDKDLKVKVNPKLLLRVFYWFRTASMYTFAFGWTLFGWKYFHQGLFFDGAGHVSNRGAWMLFGAALGTVMWFNVWFVIWPRQKQILGALAAGAPHPDAAALGATSLKVSRLNLYLSGPMLFGMIVPNNFSGWSHSGMLIAVIVGVGFWTGLVKTSFKVKTTA